MRRCFHFILLLFVWSACGRSPYPGYKHVGNGVHLHYLVLGDGEASPTDSDSVHVRLRMGWHGHGIGELFSTEDDFAVKDLRIGAFVPVFRRIHAGDSMSVIAPARAWPWTAITAGKEHLAPDTGVVRMELALIGLRTPAMVRAENERSKRNDPLGYERRLMTAYREQGREHFLRWGTSEVFYHITGTPKDTARVMFGDHVTISYQGRRMEDGLLFDDTRKNGEAFSFRFGDKDQVMPGLEVAVHLLREGQEGTFLFPSDLAFGAKGIPGVLEPHMPVEYTVRLDKVERASIEQAVR